MIKNAIAGASLKIAKKIKADAIIVISDENLLEGAKTNCPVLHIKKSFTMLGQSLSSLQESIPEKLVSRTTNDINRLEEMLIMAHINSKIKDDELVVGVIDFENVSSIVVFDMNESEMFRRLKECRERADREVIQSILFISLELGISGYEGKKIGTAFIIGDSEEVLKRSYQSIINPFKGHSIEVTDKKNWDTIKEFTQIDGMFVIDEKGRVIAAGRYMETDTKNIDIQNGLGGRHMAAATITHETQAISVVLSQSGMVRLYKDGLPTIELDSSKSF